VVLRVTDVVLRVSYIIFSLCTNNAEPGDPPDGDSVFAVCRIVEPCALSSHTPTLKPRNADGEGGYDIYRASTAFRKCKLAF
jgi:hypothetical protein